MLAMGLGEKGKRLVDLNKKCQVLAEKIDEVLIRVGRDYSTISYLEQEDCLDNLEEFMHYIEAVIENLLVGEIEVLGEALSVEYFKAWEKAFNSYYGIIAEQNIPKSLTIGEFIDFAENEALGSLFLSHQDGDVFVAYLCEPNYYSLLVPDLTLDELKEWVLKCEAGLIEVGSVL